MAPLDTGDRKAALVQAGFGALVAVLCCLSPIVLVSLGITTVAVANNWGNLLYGEYKWHFRLVALALMAVTLVLYFRSRGVCTFDAARRQRNRILNVVLLSLLTFTGLYVFGNYVVLHYLGIAAGLPWAQWDETWAIPVSIALFGAIGLAYWLLPRMLKTETAPGGGTRGAASIRPVSRD